jgi:hypothetical protein
MTVSRHDSAACLARAEAPPAATLRARLWPAAAVVTALAASLVAAPAARAQEFAQGLQDPRILSVTDLGGRYSGLVGAGVGLLALTPNFGLELGDFVLQPRLLLESEYRSNFFRQDSRNGDAVGAMALHVRPGLAVFNPQYDAVALSFSSDFDVFLPFGDESVSSRSNVGARAQVAAALLPKRAVSFTLYDRFERQIWMRPLLDRNANRNQNVAGADVSFHPGGRALDFTLGYAFDMLRYDDLGILDSDTHRLRFLGSWRFFPQTYAFIEGTFDPTSYRKALTASETSSLGNYVPGTPLKLYAGLSGHVTERLAVLLRAGYGNSLLDAGDQYESVLAQTQLSWRFNAESILHVGYARDFELAPFGGFYGYDRGYAEYSHRLTSWLQLNADFSVDARSYGTWQPAAFEGGGQTFQPSTLDTTRDELALRGGLSLDMNFMRIFGLTVGYRLDALVSDFVIVTDDNVNYVGFADHRVFASLNLRY